MSCQVTRKKELQSSAAAKPAWRLPEPHPAAAPPGAAWKWLLAAAIVVQAAWILALVVMATR
jgi:hypothetical protein